MSNQFADTFRTVRLAAGKHQQGDRQLCAMEATAYLMGEPHSDAPACTCPIIAAFVRSWNDGLRSDEERARVLGPRLLDWVGTRADRATELRRSFMAMDWYIREWLPAWLDLLPQCANVAREIRGLGEIVDATTFDASMPLVKTSQAMAAAARNAAWAAAMTVARVAEWDAAGDAARAAARNAAMAAARNAAMDAARNAEWDAAGNAARDTAMAAAMAAVMAAAGKAIEPTVVRLQESAHRLLDRMIALSADRVVEPVRSSGELLAVAGTVGLGDKA